MGADGFQKDRFQSFVWNELKNNPQVVACRTGPRTRELAFELVSFETRVHRVGGEHFQGDANVFLQRGILS